MTLVLYFGTEKWNKHSLYECLNIPDDLKPFVNDYKINIFEIANLTKEQVNMFKSDFKIVAINLIGLGYTDEEISTATSLSLEEVAKLREEVQ